MRATENAIEAVRRSVLQWRFIDEVAGRIDDAALSELLSDPAVDAIALTRDGQDIGLLELDFREADECEVAFFGLVPDAIGGGLGRFLMGQAIALASARGVSRLWLHTCTLDHPGAVAFYRKIGFVPYKRAIEITEDPRLDGTMPRHAAAWLPLIGER